MNKQMNLKKINETIRAYLGLKYHLVGVKIRKSGIREKENHLRLEKPMAFCHIVRTASKQGKAFLYERPDEACPTAVTVLGFRTPRYSEATYSEKLSDTRSVLVASLDQINENPDVILAIVTPKQLMDLTAILQAGKNELLSVGFKGEAACAEFTVKPYIEHKANLSLLCHGARIIYSDYRDNELIFGAPPEVFVQMAEVMNRIAETGEALCGCRTSDIPAEIINEFQSAGMLKGTDYFFGRFVGQNIRAYLDKDFQGRLKFVTFHLPVRMTSDKEARKIVKKLQGVLSRPYRVSPRSYWLDLTMTASIDELGIDLFDAESIEIVAKEFVNKATQYLSRIGIKSVK